MRTDLLSWVRVGRLRLCLAMGVLLVASVATGCEESPADIPERVVFCPGDEDLAALVDPMIGTRGPGNVVPGALVPHGMVKLSPDTNAGQNSVDAYEHGNDKIEGFSHTHLQGPGGSANGYSHILLIPTTGELLTTEEGYASTFSHDEEEASPGYYSVMLKDYGVLAELTATGHAGYHRYTFPPSDNARVLIDLGHSRGESWDGAVQIEGDRIISGFGEYNVHPILRVVVTEDDKLTGQSVVYFYARFSKPFDSFGTFRNRSTEPDIQEGVRTETGARIGAWAGYTTGEGDQIEVQVGISLVSVDQAKRNLEVEIGERTFDTVHAEARARWNCFLNRIHVEGGSDEEKTVFYTALFHSAFAPADYTEVDGYFFSGADGVGETSQWPQRRFYTDDWCAWDTFRTSRPLATLIEPELIDDVVRSYLHLYRQGGWLPKCTWHATGYSRVMIGNHAVPMIADAYVKGFRDYDLDDAWAAIYKSAVEETLEVSYPTLCGYLNLGTPPEYIENGFVSQDCDLTQSVSMTLEYAYNDWCIAQVAQGLGRDSDYQAFMERSGNWANHWNPDTGFLQPRDEDGAWSEPFDPADNSDGNGYCEANAWIYTWFVPHDVEGLIASIGGDASFLAKLDQFFADGYFDSSNEPSFHIPFLYNYAGAPHRAQEVVRETLAADFTAEPGGLPGNDDAGATSAWYLLAAMGIYPVTPGDSTYQIVSPVFQRITIPLDPAWYDGGTFVIEATGNSAANRYIQSATLNGATLDRTWITHAEIVAGGTLTLVMGPQPSTWGAGN